MKNIIRQVGIKNCDDCQAEYRFQSHENRYYQTNLIDYEHTIYEEVIHLPSGTLEDVARACIKPDGQVVVYEGAGSDGCTPVWLAFNRFYMGIPNGRKVRSATGLLEPITAQAFFLHDWLLKMQPATGMPFDQIHNAFCHELNKTNFWAKKAYCKIVKRYGPRK